MIVFLSLPVRRCAGRLVFVLSQFHFKSAFTHFPIVSLGRLNDAHDDCDPKAAYEDEFQSNS